jgi:BASS family bile acid:Na+ symporter
MGVSVLAPLALGVLIHTVAPRFAMRAVGRVSAAATVLLLVGFVPLLVVALPASMSLIGNGTLFAIIVFAASGIVAGHLLGGPERENRGVLALATTSRHPGAALTIGAVAYPAGQKLVMAAVVLYLLTAALVSVPYITWSKRHSAVPGGAAA